MIWSFWFSSNSHSVVVRNDCTIIPLATGEAQEDETILHFGFSSHTDPRFVHRDPPRLIGSRSILFAASHGRSL